MRGWSLRAASRDGADRSQWRDLRYPHREESRRGAWNGRSATGRSGTPAPCACWASRIANGPARSGTPCCRTATTDLAATRRPGTKKYGFGLNAGAGDHQGYRSLRALRLERRQDRGVGVHPDRPLRERRESRCKDGCWKRAGDTVGVAAVRNYLTGDDRSFLAAGGMGFIIGDGRLNYAPESITEAYYAWHAVRDWTFTLDYQRVVNPAYNRDRGPGAGGDITSPLGAIAASVRQLTEQGIFSGNPRSPE